MKFLICNSKYRRSFVQKIKSFTPLAAKIDGEGHQKTKKK